MGSIPHDLIIRVARRLAYNIAVGRPIDGDAWADIFAQAVDGEHLGKPLGLADIVWKNCAWSAKTIKHANPHKVGRVRLIVGRNSPDRSFDIPNPHADIKATGRAVLGIWNERVDIAAAEHEDLRMIVLIRDMSRLRFSLFETEVARFADLDYAWEENKRKNLVGRNKASGEHEFTWQPSGSQFTMIRRVPGSAIRFSIRRPPTLDLHDEVIQRIGFTNDWVRLEQAP